jgi:tetratricopeptide (TPR) repeat protein
MAGSAYREAMGYVEQALAAPAQLPETRNTLEQAIDLRCDLRNALLPLDEHTRILDHLCTAETLAEQLGDDQRRGRIAGQLCISLLPMDEYEQAIAAGQRALALAEELGLRPLQAHCHHGLGTLYATVSQREQARSALTTAIDLYHAIDMTFWLPQAEAALAQIEEIN